MVDLVKDMSEAMSNKPVEDYHVELRGKTVTEQLVEAQIGRMIRKRGPMTARQAKDAELKLRERFLPSSLTKKDRTALEKISRRSPL